MKIRFTQILLTGLMLLSVTFSYAQVDIFWSEDFANGIPDDWTNKDASAQGARWTYCIDQISEGDGCPAISLYASDYFGAETADNGFATLDSDAYGELPSNHVSQLTLSTIDCSTHDEVWISFNSALGVFTVPGLDFANVNVSTDGVSWTRFAPHLITIADRWSDNPTEVALDISAVAANQAEVIIQFEFIGNWEYWWSIDDIKLTNGDPRLPNNMRVDNFFAIAPNLMTPASQVDAFGFLADVSNIGSEIQDEVVLSVSISDESGTEVYQESLDYGTVETDTVIQNRPFASEGFTPDGSEQTYTGTYSIVAAQEDMDPSNNEQTFSFTITDGLFAKENGPTRAVFPADGNWDAGEAHSWGYGNAYYIVNGDNDESFLRKVFFSISNATEVVDQVLSVNVYEWIGDMNDSDEADPDERLLVASDLYLIDGSEIQDNLIELVVPSTAGSTTALQLKSNTMYIVMVEHTSPDALTNVQFGASEANDYGGMILRGDTTDVKRYAGLLAINEPLSDEPFSTLGFGADIVPAIRMEIGTDPFLDSAVEELDGVHTINVFPNPAKNELNVQLAFDHIFENVGIQIMNNVGQGVLSKQLKNTKSAYETFDTSSLPSGHYVMHITTAAGVRTQKFVIAK